MIALDVEYLVYSAIAKEAEKFLLQNNSNQIPVPIDNIIDLNYNIDIIPVPGLQDQYAIDGFMSSDCSQIYIDKFVFDYRYYRYRFTLAHEIAHLHLHKKYLCQCKFSNIDEWENFCININPNDYDIMESQGNCFGGLVLVPRDALRESIKQNLPQVMPLIEQAKSKGIPRSSYLNYALDSMSQILSPMFEVSTEVLKIRMNYDSTSKMIP